MAILGRPRRYLYPWRAWSRSAWLILQGVSLKCLMAQMGERTIKCKIRCNLPRIPSDPGPQKMPNQSEEHTSELQSHLNLVCRLLLEKKKKYKPNFHANV